MIKDGETKRLLRKEERNPSFYENDLAAGQRHQLSRQWGIPPAFAFVLVGVVLVAAALSAVRPMMIVESKENVRSSQTHEHESVMAASPSKLNLLTPGNELEHALHDRGNRERSTSGTEIDGATDHGVDDIKTVGEAERSPPNVIFVLLDDMGMNDVGMQSTDLSPLTPFIDSLVYSGVRLSKYYTNHICTPARVSGLNMRLSEIESRASRFLFWEYVT